MHAAQGIANTYLQCLIFRYENISTCTHIQWLRNSLWGNHMCFSCPVLFLSFFCGTCKEVRMKIGEAVSVCHLQVNYVILQELHTNNTWSLIRDSNKISKHSRVMKMGVKFELSCNVHAYNIKWCARCCNILVMYTYIIISITTQLTVSIFCIL